MWWRMMPFPPLIQASTSRQQFFIIINVRLNFFHYSTVCRLEFAEK